MATVQGPLTSDDFEIAQAHPRDPPKLVDTIDEDHPTESHAIASADHEEKGAAQHDHGEVEVKNLGWNEKPTEVPQLVGGLTNDKLWTLIRRFNKQMYHIKALEEPPMAGLDLQIADDEEFSPDKLRAHLERLYMTAIIGLIGFGKHIARIRSWRERKRTGAFLLVYSMAYALDILVPIIVLFMMVLIMYPPSRSYCFPPAPLSLISSKSGGVQRPPAGVLGSDDSLTGSPEKHQGEAVEQEARNFVNGFASIAVSSAVGKHPAGDPYNESQSKLEGKVPDPTDITVQASNAKDKTAGGQPNAVHDKTKEPVSSVMWSHTRPIMHGIAEAADTWERLGNALSPTPPFPQKKPRIILASVLAPVLLISLFTNSYIFMKVNGFFIGFTFFSDPLIWRGLSYLNRKVPNWQNYLKLENTLLKGVPSDAQLTLTLLRIGEANKSPLPPPPTSDVPPPNSAHATAGRNLDALGMFSDEKPSIDKKLTSVEDVSESEVADVIHPDDTPASTAPSNKDASPSKKKHGRRLIALLKGTTKGGVDTMLGADRLKAAAGAQHAKNRLGVFDPTAPAGPVDFPARYQGQKGHLYITTTATSPALSWTTAKEDVDPVFSMAIEDIQEIKKVGGLGWKSKMVVGWATDREVADGILITDKQGNVKQLTAIRLREELFNRLIAMSNHMWEAW